MTDLTNPARRFPAGPSIRSRPVHFTWNITVCTVDVKLLTAGTCVVTVNQAGGNGYLPAPEVKQSFSVGMGQVITFTSSPPNKPTVGSTYAVTATGGASGSPVVFSSQTPASCSVTGSTVLMLAPGTCTIAANQAGGGVYSAAPEVTQTSKISSKPGIAVTLTGPATVIAGKPTAVTPPT